MLGSTIAPSTAWFDSHTILSQRDRLKAMLTLGSFHSRLLGYLELHRVTVAEHTISQHSPVDTAFAIPRSGLSRSVTFPGVCQAFGIILLFLALHDNAPRIKVMQRQSSINKKCWSQLCAAVFILSAPDITQALITVRMFNQIHESSGFIACK